MLVAPLPENEPQRLSALHALDILDSPPEAEFDALVRAAALVCGVPISLISLVDAERQWFKANIGLSAATETPRDMAFCAHTILHDDIFEVTNAAEDVRFADNPLVAGVPNIHFYAGAPLRLSDGSRVGTLCVIDRQPQALNNQQREVLQCLARNAVTALEGRHAARMMKRATHELQASEFRFRSLCDKSPLGVFYTDANGKCHYANDRFQQILDLPPELIVSGSWETRVHADDRAMIVAAWWRATKRIENDINVEFRVMRPDRSVRRVLLHSRAILQEDRVVGFVGSVLDVTDRHELMLSLQEKQKHLRTLYEATPAMLHSIDMEGRLVTVSDTWLQVLGYTRSEVLGCRSTDFLTPASREYAQTQVIPAFFAKGSCEEVEYQMVTKQGQVIDVLLSAILEKNADGVPVRSLAVIKDITLRRRAEHALQEANLRATLATDSGGIGIWDWDITNNVLTWDAWMWRIYGIPPRAENCSYELWRAHVHPDDIDAAERELREALTDDKPFDTKFRVIWDDGSIHHVRGAGKIMRDATGKAMRMIGANWDITDLRRITAELFEQHELLRVTLQSIGDAVITTDAQGNIVWLNPVAERMTGWTAEEAKQKPLTQVFHIVNEETRKPVENPVTKCLMQGQIVALANHTLLIARDGEEFGIEDSAAPIRNERGEVLGVVLVFHDVTEQRRLSGEMNYRATHDVLTGLINRTEFEARIRRVLQKSHEEQSEHALLYIDLDQFKLVNDACGHTAGDLLLQQVAKLFISAIRTRDTLARLGGDEFAIILEHCSVEQAGRVAQQICERMEDFRFNHDERRFRIGTSIGLVTIDQHWPTTAAILQAADSACYAAKEAGRNRVHVWFDTDLAMRARHGEIQWTARIEHALDDNRFVLFAQRITPLHETSSCLHAEILLRMEDEDGSLIAPGAFLSAAERFHLVTRIDRWVLKRTIDWMKAAPSLAKIDMLCINLSGQSVGDKVFHRWVVELISKIDPALCAKLCLEITETAAVTNLSDATLFIEQVRSFGVRVALDDFGAGASSFGYLKTMPVDILKIDGQFIRDLVTDPLDAAAVRCFAEVAKLVNMKTIAEFVEQPEIIERLRDIGIDYAQGFLLHKPEPIAALLGLSATGTH